MRKVVAGRLVSAAPEDDDAIATALDGIKGEYKAAGMDVDKTFSADPSKEGAADPGSGGDDETKRKDKIEQIRKLAPKY